MKKTLEEIQAETIGLAAAGTVSNCLTKDELREVTILLFSFFSAKNNLKFRKELGLPLSSGITFHILSGRDFLEWLKKNQMSHIADKHFDIARLIRKMEMKGFITDCGPSGHPEPPLNKMYLCNFELTALEAQGKLWLGEILGFSYLLDSVSSFIALIQGRTELGDETSGNGILLDRGIVITNAHVLDDMSNVEKVILFDGQEFEIQNHKTHQSIDVGIVQLKSSPTYLEGLGFSKGNTLDEVLVPAHVHVPQTTQHSLTAQRGNVIGNAMGMDGNKFMLISTMVRPGNSGGPILSNRGKIVGLVTRSFERHKEEADPMAPLPYFASVPADQIVKAVRELDGTIELPREKADFP